MTKNNTKEELLNHITELKSKIKLLEYSIELKNRPDSSFGMIG